MHTAHINNHIYIYILYTYIIIFFSKAGVKPKTFKILRKYSTTELYPMTLLEIKWKVPKATVSTGEAEGDMTRRNIPALSSVKGETTESDSTGPASQEIRPLLIFHNKATVLLHTWKLDSGELKNCQKNLSFPIQGPTFLH